MFSGIVERTVKLLDKKQEGTNVHFTFECDITHELKVDQSIAHNGVCLTVTNIEGNTYSVTAIKETLDLTNLGVLVPGSSVNFERCLKLSDRLDGHIVQGHVDGFGKCIGIEPMDGSWKVTIEHSLDHRLILHKGSITVNGVSLTVTESAEDKFSVAIIPYTFEHTNFNRLAVGDALNLELDVLGKYIAKLSLPLL